MIMRRSVVSIDQERNVLDACLKFKQYKIGSLVVKNQNKSCVGILTERDVIERAICNRRAPVTTLVKEIMTTGVKTIHPRKGSRGDKDHEEISYQETTGDPGKEHRWDNNHNGYLFRQTGNGQGVHGYLCHTPVD